MARRSLTACGTTDGRLPPSVVRDAVSLALVPTKRAAFGHGMSGPRRMVAVPGDTVGVTLTITGSE